MDPEKVDSVLANTVRKQALQDTTEQDLAPFTNIQLIEEIKRRGYTVSLKGACGGCGRVIDGPHYCPGPERVQPGIMTKWPEKLDDPANQ